MYLEYSANFSAHEWHGTQTMTRFDLLISPYLSTTQRGTPISALYRAESLYIYIYMGYTQAHGKHIFEEENTY